jgi:SAM-dependent methyltransferase
VRFAPYIANGGVVLDLACGSGRHAWLLAGLGYAVVAVDRDAGALATLGDTPRIETLVVDLEAGAWPLPAGRFAGVVVTNYLHRPLFPALLDAIAPGGVLIYETFARGNERYGHPANPAYLLEPGELLHVTLGRMRVLAYEDLFVAEPKPAMVQRICARHEP